MVIIILKHAIRLICLIFHHGAQPSGHAESMKKGKNWTKHNYRELSQKKRKPRIKHAIRLICGCMRAQLGDEQRKERADL